MRAIITNIRIRNFRSINEQSIKLGKLNIIVGKNNSGKSNLIKALDYALSYNFPIKDDVHSTLLSAYNTNKELIVDIMLRPINDENEITNKFNKVWRRILGSLISIDKEGKAYFAYRSVSKFDTTRDRYTHEKRHIKMWGENIDKTRGDGNKIPRLLFDNIVKIYMDAQRDISNDILDRKSYWNILTSEIKIDETSKEAIESQLANINEELIDKSEILTNMKSELSNNISNENTIEIASITKDIDNLYKGMDIFISDKYQEPMAIINSGLGSRSWAVFSTIKTLTNYYQERNLDQGEPYLPILLIEEPEAHIHPQAQRKLLNEIKGINGQLFITTHSSYIFKDIDFNDLIYAKLVKGETEYRRINREDLPSASNDLINLKRNISNANADLLYSNMVVLMEGDTEKYLIPKLFKKYFGFYGFEFGVDFIFVSGSGAKYRPYLNILNLLDIPWVIFSDGEEKVINELDKELKKISDSGGSSNERKNVFVIKENKNLENYLAFYYEDENYLKNIIEKDQEEKTGQKNYLDWYIKKHQGKPRKKGVNRDYYCENGVRLAIADILTEKKILCADILSRQIEKNNIPELITDMFDYIKKKVGF